MNREKFIYDPSLVLYLPLYELDGSSFASRDAYGRLCTNYGAVWTSWGRSFDGVDDLIYISPWIPASGPGTIEGWFYFTQLASAKGTYNVLFNNLYQHPSNNYLYFTNTSDSFDWAPSEKTWYHLVVTYTDPTDTSTAKLYVNSEAPYSVTQRGPPHNIIDLLTISDGYGYAFKGFIDNVRVYSRALSAIEIQGNYLATRWRYQ